MFNYLKKGNGEMLGFAVVGPIICYLALFLVSFIQMTTATNAINQSLSVFSRAVAICSSEKDAKEQIKNIKNYAINCKYIDSNSINVKISFPEKGNNKDKWLNGNYILITVSAKIKTIEPFIHSKIYSKSFIVAIEGSEANEATAIEIMKNIMYAVESGGQVYGNRNYANFEMPGANTSNEVYITIGAGCWYGEEAKQILQYIQSVNGQELGDIASILAAWDSVKYGNSYKEEIINILNSTEGHKRQDEFMLMQIKKYFKMAEQDGVTDVGGKMEWTNIYHQGGGKAIRRLLPKCQLPMTAKSFYDAMQNDSGNQVGAYRTRQNFVYNNILLRVEQN